MGTYISPEDMSTRFSISLLSLLTFEVMAERVTSKIPDVERTTWSTVWHAFHMFFLTGCVLQNGVAAYSSLFVYRSLGASGDKTAKLTYPVLYIAMVLILLLVNIDVHLLLGLGMFIDSTLVLAITLNH